ncbi:MAG: hypothetical protein F4W68_00330 [Cenarchaeum sp. SB0661_bin_35]|nr:hypothetical protein [Cenarchaeum sp. SB0667_bin_13]MXZ94134.1 hypothetical protein [Cenarchaeum sp. SB0666_bin_15]MYC78946.1 hypothetical protein [Cenarchaeum sp. SB0661_bin_35]MYD58298.1 hypothetical protein [Cenarchaeum sp. SB0678_bin_8]MYI51269.1 hypothetical protein [Cenarchaeum sp. SB0673_bin_9]MYJ27946.1 hypothetical protein [Cenarchaeum sp. SB0672_bin_9]
MGGIDILLEDHRQIRRLGLIILQCHKHLRAGLDIPIADMQLIVDIMDDFLDSIHYSREEDSYFPCVATHQILNDDIRKLLIEHEFSRRISHQISRHLAAWRDGHDSREPVYRYMKAYWIYLNDHMSKEERFFEKAQKQHIHIEEDQRMSMQFQTMKAAIRLDCILDDISYLESREWYKKYAKK